MHIQPLFRTVPFKVVLNGDMLYAKKTTSIIIQYANIRMMLHSAKDFISVSQREIFKL